MTRRSSTRRFVCAVCERAFAADWTEEDAEAELAAAFPGQDKADCALVCEDCYRLMMREIKG